jgi:hypothetical protein
MAHRGGRRDKKFETQGREQDFSIVGCAYLYAGLRFVVHAASSCALSSKSLGNEQ